MERGRRTFLVVVAVLIASPAQGGETRLASCVGGSVTIPEPVRTWGYLQHERTVIAAVTDGKQRVEDERFQGRLFWDGDTGLFNITALGTLDSGTYTVDAKDNGVLTLYLLTVYAAVPVPTVNVSDAGNCTLLCFVEDGGDGTTLSWYGGEALLNQTGSLPVLPLVLPQQGFFSSPHRCLAENPACSRSLEVNATALCFPGMTHGSSSWHRIVVVVVVVVVVLLLVLLFLLIWFMPKKRRRRSRETPEEGSLKLELHVTEQEDNVPESGSRPPLSSVYDKLEAHRIVQPQDV